MNYKFFKSFLFCALISFITVTASAEIEVKASIDSDTLMMGRKTQLRLSVSKPDNIKGYFPLLSEASGAGLVTVCGDSIEIGSPTKIDTVRDNGRLYINYLMNIQSFDSGFYRLPRFVYLTDSDSVLSNEVTLLVTPVKVKADSKLEDFSTVSDPEKLTGADEEENDNSSKSYLWWIIPLALVILSALIYLLIRYKKHGHILPPKPQPTPYERAVAELKKLKSEKLWEQGMEKEYYTRLIDILRQYLAGRFDINAMEMTSRQILRAMKNNSRTKDFRGPVRQILDMADFVKFAKVRPLPDDNIKAFDYASDFIEKTKPVPVEQSGETDVAAYGETIGNATQIKKPLEKGGEK